MVIIITIKIIIMGANHRLFSLKPNKNNPTNTLNRILSIHKTIFNHPQNNPLVKIISKIISFQLIITAAIQFFKG